MSMVPTDRIRNVALISHSKAGKTQLVDALLYAAGVSGRLGKVDQGSATTDFDPEEIQRKMSIQTAVATFQWQGYRINLLDTPGYFDFVADVHGALRAADSAIIVCDATAGVEVGTRLVWQYADQYRLPRLIYVNKLDRDHADYDKVLSLLKTEFGSRVVPLQWPVGREASFRGVVDLLAEEVWSESSSRNSEPIPQELKDQVGELRLALVEAIAETDEQLLEDYLGDRPIPPDRLRLALRSAVQAGDIIPVLAGSGLTGVGVELLLAAITELLPGGPSGDAQFSAFVFKTMVDPYVGRLSLLKICSGSMRAETAVYNSTREQPERVGQLLQLCGKEQRPVEVAGAGDIVAVAKLQSTFTGDTLCAPGHSLRFEPVAIPNPVFPVALEPRTKGDEEKISTGLARLAEEDPSFRVERNTETRQILVYGMGELHLDVLLSRLERKFGVGVDKVPPKVPYRETVTRIVQAEYKHKKQSGGRGQYGHVFLRIEPLARGEGFIFEEEIFGGAVPRQYIPAVEKGVLEAMAEGVLAGYPVTDVKVVLYDGSYHSVDSSELAFKLAAAQAFKKGCREAAMVLLEPVVLLEIEVPEANMGDILGDLNRRRGKILSMDQRGENQFIRAHVPLAETFEYAIDLRSMTQGRGTFTLKHSHYEEVPETVARQVLAK